MAVPSLAGRFCGPASRAPCSAAGSALAQQPAAQQRRGPRDRPCGSTWIRPSWMPPTIRSSTRRICRRSSSATRPTARPCVPGLGAAATLRLRPTPDRSAGCLRDQARERADQHLHSWRGVARGLAKDSGVSGRAVRPRRRTLRGARLHQRDRGQRQPHADGRAGAPRGCVGLSQRPELRGRPGPHLRVRPLLGRPSGRRRPGHRLAQGLQSSGRHGERRAVLQWHVRPEAGASLGAQLLRQVHRRDRAGAELAASSRPAQRPRHRRLRHISRRRSSSASRATSPRR